MRPPFYIRQLTRDLDEWIAKGWVPAEHRAAILASAGAGGGMTLSAMIAVLGVILIGAAAMSFVAANWQDMSKTIRLIVLFGTMWLAFGAAAALYGSRPWLTQALVLLGVLMFGANVMLIAQTYHINAHHPDGTLLWGLGALTAAALVPSRAALAMALILGGLWTYQERFEFNQLLHLPFLLYWGACAALAGWLRWRPGVHLCALALLGWLFLSAEGVRLLLGWNDVQIASMFALAPMALWAGAAAFKPESERHALTMEHYAVFVMLIAFCILHIFGKQDTDAASWLGVALILSAAAVGATAYGLRNGSHTIIDIAGVGFFCAAAIGFVRYTGADSDERRLLACIAILIVSLWMLARGTRVGDKFLINLSLVLFGGWVLYAYFVVFNSFMDQAMFLLMGGILLVGLSLLLDRLRRRLTTAQTPGATP